MKTLNVKPTTINELVKQWGFVPPLLAKAPLYIRCNVKGVINWDKAPVYGAEELVGRNNVNIITS